MATTGAFGVWLMLIMVATTAEDVETARDRAALGDVAKQQLDVVVWVDQFDALVLLARQSGPQTNVGSTFRF